MMKAIAVVVCLQVLCSSYAALIGEPCTSTTQCPDSSTCVYSRAGCSSGVCECLAGLEPVPEMNECVTGADFGGQCDNDANCQLTTAHAVCVREGNSRTCDCTAGEERHIYGNGQATCYVQDWLENCAEDQSGCLTIRMNNNTGACVPDAGPDDLVCDCAQGYVWRSLQCLPVEHGEVCVDDNDADMVCESNTECLVDVQTKRCQCPANTTWRIGRNACVHDDAEENLQDGEECNTDYASATARICDNGINLGLQCGVCPEDAGGQMTCLAPRGDLGIGIVCNLTITDQCQPGNAECMLQYEGCDEGTCQCYAGYVLVDGICEPMDTCYNTADCVASGYDNAVCMHNHCECGAGTRLYEHEGMRYCYERAANDLCDHEAQCLTHMHNSDGGVCSTICGCNDRYRLVGELCMPYEYGSECDLPQGSTRVCEATSTCVVDPSDETIMRCLCSANFENVWDDQYNLCMHYMAERNLIEGSVCNTDPHLSSGLICAPGLVCTQCTGSDDVDDEWQCRQLLNAEDPNENPDDPNGDDPGDSGTSSVTIQSSLIASSILLLYSLL